MLEMWINWNSRSFNYSSCISKSTVKLGSVIKFHGIVVFVGLKLTLQQNFVTGTEKNKLLSMIDPYSLQTLLEINTMAVTWFHLCQFMESFRNMRVVTMELLHYCIYIYEIDCFPYEHDIDKHIKHKMK